MTIVGFEYDAHSSFYRSRLEDSAVEARTFRATVSFDELSVVHFGSERRAGHARRGDFQNYVADKKPIADRNVFVVEILDYEVLTKFPVFERFAKILAPTAEGYGTLNINRLVDATVVSPVADCVTVQPINTNLQASFDRMLVDAGLVALAWQDLRMPYTDGEQVH